MSVQVVGAFACPGTITARAVSTNLPFASGRYPYWRQSFPIRGKCKVFPPFSLRVTPSLSPAYVTFEYQRWKRSEVVAQQWDICYVMQLYLHPSVVRAKSYGKSTVTCYGDCSPVCKTLGSATHSLIVGKTVGVWRHVACCRAISDILHDLLA